ncbi:MAG TPA: ribosome-associated translation inhibitor RaiA [bacterium]|nr:ribosome-associated translation inhibitor RaiA [bacterium]
MGNLLDTTFTFRNMDSTDALRSHALDKLAKLDKYLFKPGKAHVIFNMEGPRHVAEITLHIKGKSVIGVGSSNDMYTSVDEAVDRIKKQMSKEKERVKGHKGE